VLCTCTSVPIGEGPVVDLSGARSNLHIKAVGADFPGKTELPMDYLRSAVVRPDVVEQCMIEGESQLLERDDLDPSMVEVVGGRIPNLVEQATIFDSTGWSYEDLLAARLFLTHARRLGVGIHVELQIAPDDPYETLRATAALRPTQDWALVRESG
jgi:ornithine cyclodeaminase/alanine dehydrogenase-like protein (mu-crystallin family)